MPTTADYLNDLVAQKEALADGLSEYGVEVEEGETFSTLVPKNNEVLTKAKRFKDLWEAILAVEPFSYEDDKLTTLKSEVFSYTSIQSLSLPECTTVTGKARGCSKLTTLDLPKCEKIQGTVQNTSTIVGAFSENKAIKSLYLPELTTIENSCAFASCTSLESVDLPKLSSVAAYGSAMFRGCSKLTSVNLPLCPLPSVGTNGQSWFGNCTSLTTISLPSAKCIPYTTFTGCTALKSVYAEKATVIGFMPFPSNLVTLEVPSCIKVDQESLKKVTSLTSVTLCMDSSKTITLVTRSIEGCSKLTTLMFEAAITCSDGHDIALSGSPLNLESAKRIISKLVDYKGTDREYAQKVTFSSTTLALLEADGATAPGDITWTEYARSKGWNI